MIMSKPFFITTAIDYVNGEPHVGHAAEKVLTDAVARYHRDVLHEETFFLTGTDENSLKNVQGAEKAGRLVDEYVKENAEAFRSLGDSLGLSFDRFIRTTEDVHFAGAKKFWSVMNPKDLYKKSYHGLYCVGCEEFKMEKDLVEGKCPEHLTVPEVVEEENWFFRLSTYGDILRRLIMSGELSIVPEFRKNEVLSFIDMGLEDFSVSRSVARAKGWGVPVPGDEEQIMYVWVDALSNYITALDYSGNGADYDTYWAGDGERVHVIGKGILRFHAIYWPAMLLSAKLPLPTEIYTHEYLTIDGQKMSKSLGNVLYPAELVERFGKDGARYLLLTALPYSKDGDLSWAKMTEKYNADLANGLGNLVSRVMRLSEGLDDDMKKIAEIPTYPDDVAKLIDSYRFTEALEKIWETVREANRFIEEEKPWELAKNERERFVVVINDLLGRLSFLSVALVPFMPDTAAKIRLSLESGTTEILFQRVK
ncbi:MAG: methionine--tRNA ligase [Candidatus Moranbacteria bacterium]|nr:methionine--tRNA ligase [Candidatus Moranbacteria bacterium]